MHRPVSQLRTIAFGLTVGLALAGAMAAAQQVRTGPVKGAIQPDFVEPCCSITAIDIKTGVITARVTKTGHVFKLEGIAATALAKFKVGEAIEMSCAVPSGSGTTGVTGNAASGTGTAPCGNNSPRNADTRPKDCVATSSTGVQTPIACPPGVPIKVAK